MGYVYFISTEISIGTSSAERPGNSGKSNGTHSFRLEIPFGNLALLYEIPVSLCLTPV